MANKWPRSLRRRSGQGRRWWWPGMGRRLASCAAPAAVRFVGRATAPEVAQLLHGCLAAGRPLVASRARGIPALVRDDIDGLLVPPRDADALATAMLRMANAGELASRLGSAGRQRALEISTPALDLQGLLEAHRPIALPESRAVSTSDAACSTISSPSGAMTAWTSHLGRYDVANATTGVWRYHWIWIINRV